MKNIIVFALVAVFILISGLTTFFQNRFNTSVLQYMDKDTQDSRRIWLSILAPKTDNGLSIKPEGVVNEQVIQKEPDPGVSCSLGKG